MSTKYDNVDIVFISHHTEAKEVTEEQFFTQGESGGTVVSSAYQLALEIIKQRYRPADWNIYPFHFSDGDNYYSDNEEAVRLADELISTCNLFGYGEIGEEGSSSYRRSSGALLSIFTDRLQNKDRFVGVRIDDKEDVYPALKQFFGRRGVGYAGVFVSHSVNVMEDREIKELETAVEQIWEIAQGFGLDPYPTNFEIVPATVMYEVGSYALPGRYSHWTFGKAYHRMKTMYDFGLSKIYEVVINTNPSYGFLLETNSPIQNKMVIAHVLGPRRFLQKQHLLLEDQPAHGRECFNARAANDGVRVQARPQDCRTFSRRGAGDRRAHRSVLLHQARDFGRRGKTARRSASERWSI